MGRRGGGSMKVMYKQSPGMKQDVSNVTSMFNQMLGTERPDSQVILPKYRELLSTLITIADKTKKFATSVILKLFPEHADHFRSMVNFAREIEEECQKYAIPDFPKQTDATVLKAHFDKIIDNYIYLKECPLVKRLINVCSALKKQKRYIGDPDKLSAEFIVTSVEPDLCLLGEFTNLPFKLMFISDKMHNKEEAKKYVLNFLNILWERTYALYKIISSPDVDVDKFVEIVSGSIDQVKKQIPRCDQAFNKIKNATHLLKDNFDGYYKDFVESENPTIIMENFISDVAQTAGGDPKIVMQFKRIISFYKKNAQAHMQKNPQLKQVFSMVNNQLSALDDLADKEKKERKKRGEKVSDDEDGSEDNGEDGSDNAKATEETTPQEPPDDSWIEEMEREDKAKREAKQAAKKNNKNNKNNKKKNNKKKGKK